MAVGGVFLILLGSVFFGVDATLVQPSWPDFFWLMVLAVACTAIPFVLSLQALRHLSAFSTQIAINLEPVYAIALAALWLGEHQQLSWQFYQGALAILAVVFAQPRIDPSRK
jgi:drug/metabolite transporter (DMT)-like permease